MKRTLFFVFALSYACGFAQESKELTKLKQQSNAVVTMSNSTANPNFIRFENAERSSTESNGCKGKSKQFLATNFKAFNLNSEKDMVFVEETTDNYGLKECNLSADF